MKDTEARLVIKELLAKIREMQRHIDILEQDEKPKLPSAGTTVWETGRGEFWEECFGK